MNSKPRSDAYVEVRLVPSPGRQLPLPSTVGNDIPTLRIILAVIEIRPLRNWNDQTRLCGAWFRIDGLEKKTPEHLCRTGREHASSRIFIGRVDELKYLATRKTSLHGRPGGLFARRSAA